MYGFTFEDEVSCKSIFTCAGCNLPTISTQLAEFSYALVHIVV